MHLPKKQHEQEYAIHTYVHTYIHTCICTSTYACMYLILSLVEQRPSWNDRVKPTEDKKRENKLGWFKHVCHRSLDVVVKMSDMVTVVALRVGVD